MGIVNIVKKVKQIHANDIVLVKVEKFYQSYGRDSYIVSYLFGYKLKQVEDVSMCGFSENSLNKVMASLENKKINYLILDRRNNYEVDNISDNKNLNTYEKIFSKAKKYINNKRRIDNITNLLVEKIEEENFKDIMQKIEEILYERRKI